MRSIRESRLRIVEDDFDDAIARLVSAAKHRVTIAAPYITSAGAERINRSVPTAFRGRGCVLVLTDLSPDSIAAGSIEPEAVRSLTRLSEAGAVSHLPRLHAKVYIADNSSAIVTSANLTHGGFTGNHECGVAIEDPALVDSLRARIDRLIGVAAPVAPEHLDRLCDAAGPLRDARRASDRAARAQLPGEIRRLIRRESDALVSAKLAGGAMHTVFERTIAYLLEARGPMRTTDLHAAVRSMHPDLCDDSVDRVIDGVRFGKKWKHAVRTAQQSLKKKGLTERDGDGRWRWLG